MSGRGTARANSAHFKANRLGSACPLDEGPMGGEVGSDYSLRSATVTSPSPGGTYRDETNRPSRVFPHAALDGASARFDREVGHLPHPWDPARPAALGPCPGSA